MLLTSAGRDRRFVRLGVEKFGNAGRKDMVVLRLFLAFFLSDAYSLDYCLLDRYEPATHSFRRISKGCDLSLSVSLNALHGMACASVSGRDKMVIDSDEQW